MQKRRDSIRKMIDRKKDHQFWMLVLSGVVS